jgi:DNA-binding IclR family transcriptional regulator
VVALLCAFSPAARTLSLAELSARSGLPVPTAHRLARELVEAGLLEKTEAGRYQVGMRLWEIGTLATTQQVLKRAALPYMQDLYESTHENVQLAVLDGREVMYIEKISGHRSVDTLTQVAGRLPLHATGVGKIILAFSEPALLESILADGLTPCTKHTIVVPSVLRSAVAKARSEHLGYSREEMTLGAASVAAPVLAPDGTFVAALAIVAKSSTNVEALAPAVRTAALGIGRRIAPRAPGGWRAGH